MNYKWHNKRKWIVIIIMLRGCILFSLVGISRLLDTHMHISYPYTNQVNFYQHWNYIIINLPIPIPIPQYLYPFPKVFRHIYVAFEIFFWMYIMFKSRICSKQLKLVTYKHDCSASVRLKLLSLRIRSPKCCHYPFNEFLYNGLYPLS